MSTRDTSWHVGNSSEDAVTNVSSMELRTRIPWYAESIELSDQTPNYQQQHSELNREGR